MKPLTTLEFTMTRLYLYQAADETWRPVGSGDLPLLRSGETLRVYGPASDADYGAVAVGLGLAVLNNVNVVRMP